MTNGDNVLGTLQKQWFDQQKGLRKTYFWLNKIGKIPKEKNLEILNKCCVLGFNTSCFEEGVCCDPNNPLCANKEKR